jgi:protein-disulfide isomerase
MVEIALTQFNITKHPTLIVDNKKYEGVVKKEQMQTIICSSLKNATPCQQAS